MSNIASGSVKFEGVEKTFIIEGHGRVKPGDVISKSVPGYGRVFFEVTASGGLRKLR